MSDQKLGFAGETIRLLASTDFRKGLILGLLASVLVVYTFSPSSPVALAPDQGVQSIAENAPEEPVAAASFIPIEAVKVTARDLFAAYGDNELAAQNKYGDHTLEVSGRMDSVDLDMSDDPVLVFDVGGVGDYVSAEFLGSGSDALAGVRKSQNVTVRCSSVHEVLGNPRLNGCSVVD